MANTPVRTARHEARHSLSIAMEALVGRPGMTKEEQVESLNTAVSAIIDARNTLIQIRDLAAERDLAAHIEAKSQEEDSDSSDDDFDEDDEDEEYDPQTTV